MKFSIFLILFPYLLILSACFQSSTEHHAAEEVCDFHTFEIKYAKGFSLVEFGNERAVLIHDPSSGAILDTLSLDTGAPNKTKCFQRIITQSTTHFAFIHAIGQLNTLAGLCGIQYLNDAQKAVLHNTKETCNAQGIDLEKAASLNPDLFMLYPFGDKDKYQLNRLGINTIYVTEYLETTPLARAEWLKFFALVSGLNPNNSGFEAIEKKYLALVEQKTAIPSSSNDSLHSRKQEIQTKNESKTVVFNLPFGENWDMPSGNSISAALVKDAGLTYLFDENKKTGNITLKIEEAYQQLSVADFWVIIAARPKNYSKKDLIAENRIYAHFPAVKNDRILFCNSETSPYFSEGPTEPHVMLKELIACLNGRDAEHKYFTILK